MANFTGNAGNNSITGTNEDDLIEGLGGNDVLTGLAGDDTLDGGEGNNILSGDAGNDVLQGGSGTDNLNGGTGNDTLNGGEGNDSFTPGTGVDIVVGGDGIDNINISNGNDTADTTVIFTDSNNSTTFIGGSNDGTTFQEIENVSLITGSGNDNIDLRAANSSSVFPGAGNDRVKGSTSGQNSLNGEAGDDTLEGGSGRDFLNGGADNDLLLGEAEKDNLSGGAGNDTLNGVDFSSNTPGTGEIDNLSGGTGSDKFILGDSANIYYDDRNALRNGTSDYALIRDFNPDEDTVQLQGSPNNYRLEVLGVNTNLLIDKGGNEPDELIARFQNVNGLNLNSDAFEYVNPVNQVAFSDGGYTVNEDGTAEVTVVRTGNTTGEINITISLGNGTATAPGDFDNTAIPVTFADGESSKTVTIPIVNDTIFEPNETINLALTNLSTGVTLGEQSSSVLTIVDNDIVDNDSPVPGTLSFNSPSYSINEDGTPIIAVSVLRTGGSDLEVNATISLSDGTAIAGQDYNNQDIVVNFADGETSKIVTIPLVDDTSFEPNETVNLTLSNPTNGATLGTQTAATVTIIDDDAIPGVLAFSQTEFSVNEDGTPIAAVTVIRTEGSDGPVSATIALSEDTATNPEDYIVNNVFVSFENGETQKTVNIPIINDDNIEPNQTINLTLSNPTGGVVIGNQNTAILNIIDDDLVPTLTVDIATDSVNESDGTVSATITRNTATDNPLEVSLTSSDNTEITTPATVIIPGGESSVTVDLTIVDDSLVDATQNVTVIAIASDFTNGSDEVSVINNDTVNNPPTVENSIANQSTLEDATFSFTFAEDTFNDLDLADTLNYSATLASGEPLPSWLSFDGQTRTFSGIPTNDDVATIGVKVTASDGLEKVSQIFNLTVENINDLPAATNDTYETNEDQLSTILARDLLTNDRDVDGDELTITEVNNSTNSTVKLDTDGNVLFTPDSDFNGLASFEYTVTDGTETANAIVEVSVNPVNDLPVATNDTVETNEDQPLIILTSDLLNNDSDIDGDSLTITQVNNSANGIVQLNTDGNILFTPDSDFNGLASFEYTLGDGTDTTSATVEITVNPVNDDNIINGTTGRDSLLGTDNNDIITGFQGVDRITTGAGKDQLIYNSIVDAGDLITDFDPLNDIIDLQGVLQSIGFEGSNAIDDGYVQLVDYQSRGTSLQIDADSTNGSAMFRPYLFLQDVSVAEINDNPNSLTFG